jgi:NitT/TauT family transport system substrate-binding protein
VGLGLNEGRKTMSLRTLSAAALAAALLATPAHALDTLKLAIGQHGLWDSSFGEAGQKTGIFKKYGLDVQTFYTSSGGETLQVVISGSSNIGVSAGTLGVLGAYGKGAPLRIIAAEATGTAEYYFVRAESPLKKLQDAKPENTLAYSTNGSGTHITALRFMKQYDIQPKLAATGTVPATFTQVMSGQIDIGFSTPPFGLKEEGEGKIRILALANDLDSIRTQTVRVIVANAKDLAERPDVYKRFIKAYGEVIDFMYSSDPKALQLYAEHANISPEMAKTVRDKFYPKSMLQLGRIDGLDGLMEDAVAFKYLPKPLTPEQQKDLLQLQGEK